MSNNFWREIEKPIKVLAPMAGYTDSAFRLLCREYGADVLITELISADAIAYSCEKFDIERKDGFVRVSSKTNHNTAEMLSFFEAERPLVVQLFGKHPENFAKAAKWLSEELRPDGVDINMGCPARKVVGSDHGAALLKNPSLAEEIVRAVKENTILPVSVKTRLGWSNDDEILEFGPRLVSAGAETIILHGRKYSDGFKGAARWANIFALKEILGEKAIIIGNGDILGSSQFSVISSQNQTKLDGFAIGRGVFGKPYVFSSQFSVLSSQIPVPGSQLSVVNSQNPVSHSQLSSLNSQSSVTNTEHLVSDFQSSGNNTQSPAVGSRVLKDLIERHAKLVFEAKGVKGIIEFRKHLLTYLRGFPQAKELRNRAISVENIEDVNNIVNYI